MKLTIDVIVAKGCSHRFLRNLNVGDPMSMFGEIS